MLFYTYWMWTTDWGCFTRYISVYIL